MKFSKNGKYVATAGQDGVIRVWEVILDRGQSYTPSSAQSGSPANFRSENGNNHGAFANGGSNQYAEQAQQEGSTLYEGYSSDCPVLKGKPFRVYLGHKQDVLELCWSKSQFVLSASMDKTVKLWHISMDECLRTFK